LGRLGGQAEAARSVLAVGDAGMDVVLFARQRNAALERLAAWRSYDVSDEQQVEGVC
jgi:hypothetical protein